jgi:hypothetical protein
MKVMITEMDLVQLVFVIVLVVILWMTMTIKR